MLGSLAAPRACSRVAEDRDDRRRAQVEELLLIVVVVVVVTAAAAAPAGVGQAIGAGDADHEAVTRPVFIP